LAEPRLDSVLGHDDDLKNAFRRTAVNRERVNVSVSTWGRYSTKRLRTTT
jgi:hypothetical protein